MQSKLFSKIQGVLKGDSSSKSKKIDIATEQDTSRHELVPGKPYSDSPLFSVC
jgi:hypothetical protein